MANVASDLAKTYLEKLIHGAISESRYLFCMPRIEKEYEKERNGLEAERTTIRERADVATRRGDNIHANVRHWEEDVDELIGEDENAAQTKHKCFYGICHNCVWRYRRGKELANKTEQIRRMIEKGEKLENVGVASQLPGVERYSSQYYIPFESRESKYKELLDALKDDSNYIVGLQGMGGTGKTTLAKEVGKELKQSEHFCKVIVTIVSCTPDIKKIQDDIAGQLGLEWGENCNQSDRPGKLWKRLTDGEKILVILDDVWDQDPPLDFEAIGIPKQDKHGGCKLLVTTRTKQILINVDCNNIIELDLLSEEEAWIMFKRYAGINNNATSKSLIEKGRNIAEECKRLPVAISVIASSLKGQHHRPHVWNATLNSLKNPVSMQGVDEERVGIYKYLKPSFDNMRDEKAKGLFFLCSLFPEDEEIYVELLIRLGIGAGLFGEQYGSYENARNEVVIAKNKLLDSCLLLEEGEGYVKMHDLVRDAARWMKKEEIREVHLSHEGPNLLVEKENTTTKYMLCEGKAMNVFNSRFCGSNLEILITRFGKHVGSDYVRVDSNYVQVEVPNYMFENIARLRALLIQNECNFRSHIALSLPGSIQSLTNIRSLLVERVNLEDISVLGNLQSLETLDLTDCMINELPLEITKLKKLKLLSLRECQIRRNNPFQIIGECSSLEELNFYNSFNSFSQEIIFPKLQKYYIYREIGWNIKNQYELPSRCVVLRGDVGFSEATFKYCMETVEILWLKEIKWVWRNLIPEIVPVDKGLNDLVHLHLEGISKLQCLIDFNDSNVSNVMSKLVVLELYEMQNLEELCNGVLSFDSFKSLEKLEIKKCNHLQSLFKYKLNLCNLKIMRIVNCPMLVSLSTFQNLVLLEEMEIEDCEQLESIIIVDDDERREQDELGEVVVDRDNRNKSHGSMFQKLKVLFIHGCPLLECILRFLVDCDLPVLETINIKRCHGLKYIFGKEVILGSLNKLILFELPNFIDIFPECCLAMSSPKKGLASTSRSCSMPQTKSHPIICNSFSWAHICCYVKKNKQKLRTTTSTKSQDCSVVLESNFSGLHKWKIAQCLLIQPHILCNITMIVLYHLSKIKSVFIQSVASRLMMLESLTIIECHELKHIIIETGEDNSGNNWAHVFLKLKKLHVGYCDQLEYIFGHYAVGYQNNSQIQFHLPVLNYLQLCELPSLVAMCPKNYVTTFPSLTELVLNNCSQPQVAINSIGDLVGHTTIKELNGDVDYFCALERLRISNIQVENVFCLNEKYEEQVNLVVLQDIDLEDMPVMKYLFVGPINSLTLRNLTRMRIRRCNKLDIIFTTCVIRCLPQLSCLHIEECKELKHIIEEDGVEDQNMSSSRTCFPKLRVLVIVKCDKLKYVFPVSIGKGLPELKILLIRKADELEKIFRSKGDDHKIEIPNLKVIAFDDLPSLCQLGIQFHAVEHHFFRNCQKLSETSASTQSLYRPFQMGFEGFYELRELIGKIEEESKKQDTGIGNLSVGNNIVSRVADEDDEDEDDGEEASENEQSMNEQCSVGEIDTTVATSQENDNNVLKEIKDQSILEDAAPPEQIITSKQKDDCKGQKGMASFSAAKEDIDVRGTQKSIDTCDQVSLNDRVDVKMSSVVIEDQLSISKDHEIRVLEPKPSLSIPYVVVSQSPSIPLQGNHSQIVEDLSSSSHIIRELEQLVFNKQLASENISLLTDFLVKHPSVRLTNNSLTNKYKGYAYNCLAELLKFLQTHSVLDVLSSNHFEFVELLQDTRSFAFDKEWLDGVERHVLFHDLQVSQDQDALQKLLHSKQRVTKEVEMLRLKIDIFSQQLEDLKLQLESSEATLKSINKQEEQVLKSRAALSAPIGY